MNHRIFISATGIAVVATVAAALSAPSPRAAIANTPPPQHVSPPSATVEYFDTADWEQLLVSQRKRTDARIARYERVEDAGGLEMGSAGLHLAQPFDDAVRVENPNNLRETSPSGYEFWDLASARTPDPATFPLTVTSAGGAGTVDLTSTSRVSLARLLPARAFTASAVPHPAGSGYTLKLVFTQAGLDYMSVLVGGETSMSSAGWDWAHIWRQQGAIVTQMDCVLVASDSYKGHFSIRDLLIAGISEVTLELPEANALTQSEASALVQSLN
ncbi:MAG: hypothetical protein H6831_08795 [Planctomycetes bacterium]|nr:hypothetical protein [Planctomycetota bacterium]